MLGCITAAVVTAATAGSSSGVFASVAANVLPPQLACAADRHKWRATSESSPVGHNKPHTCPGCAGQPVLCDACDNISPFYHLALSTAPSRTVASALTFQRSLPPGMYPSWMFPPTNMRIQRLSHVRGAQLGSKHVPALPPRAPACQALPPPSCRCTRRRAQVQRRTCPAGPATPAVISTG